MSTIKNADIIVGLERGQVIEYGTHDQLMQKKGLYYELVIAQSEKEKEKAKGIDSDQENEMEERLAVQAAMNRPRRASRRMSIMQRRFSIISVKSVASEVISETGEELGNLDEVEVKPFFTKPFLIKIMQLNSPEWLYLLLGGLASLAYGAVMPVSFSPSTFEAFLHFYHFIGVFSHLLRSFRFVSRT